MPSHPPRGGSCPRRKCKPAGGLQAGFCLVSHLPSWSPRHLILGCHAHWQEKKGIRGGQSPTPALVRVLLTPVSAGSSAVGQAGLSGSFPGCPALRSRSGGGIRGPHGNANLPTPGIRSGEPREEHCKMRQPLLQGSLLRENESSVLFPLPPLFSLILLNHLEVRTR